MPSVPRFPRVCSLAIATLALVGCTHTPSPEQALLSRTMDAFVDRMTRTAPATETPAHSFTARTPNGQEIHMQFFPLATGGTRVTFDCSNGTPAENKALCDLARQCLDDGTLPQCQTVKDAK